MTLAVKRGLDAAVATAGLIALSPLLLAVALAIKIESPRLPLFFNDTVMGRDGVRFRMRKFRTMLPHPIDYDHRPEVTSGNPLVTRVGAVLRRLKLDELPQLWNVLRGDMSLVGPRPMDPARYARATEFQRQRLLMRPGLTGWAQVNGNINWTWDARMEMDVWYIANWSLRLDLRILLMTIPVLLVSERRRDVGTRRITDPNFRVNRPGRS
ncbi:MAG TPA: sugar transferase [Vicinamibacterales bacterium]|jgi:lipopolysaccharide/colanic/teichoic acid biosynthesis glycosyltransferase|nr:sugar transferase [Vicinamibacterales bacterium]